MIMHYNFLGARIPFGPLISRTPGARKGVRQSLWQLMASGGNYVDFVEGRIADQEVLPALAPNELDTEIIRDKIDRYEANYGAPVTVFLARIIHRSTYGATTTQFKTMSMQWHNSDRCW